MNAQPSLFGRPEQKLSKPPRKPRDEKLEWIDPETDEHHICPIIFAPVITHIGIGKEKATLAPELLREMGLPVNPRNERHLRKAIEIFRKRGWPIVSYRSAKGGYFVARTEEELEAFLKFQERLARSMIKNAERMRDTFRRMNP